MKLNKTKNNLLSKYCKKIIVIVFRYAGKFSTFLRIKKLKKLLTWEFYENQVIAVLKFLIKRNPISPFYAFWKTLFVAKEWKSFKSYFKKFNKKFWTCHPFVSAFGSFVFLLIIVGGTFLFVFNRGAQEAKATWWSDEWDYRKVLEIDHTKVTGDLTDFPVLVSFIDSDLIAKTQEDGDDIAFVLTNKKLFHEIESYDSATGTLIAWVKIPILSSSIDTKIEMYYGNFTASSQQDAENVWDDDFVMVQHMNEDPSGTAPQILDSTINNNDGTSAGTMILANLVNSKIAEGLDFDGNDDNVGFGDKDSLDIGVGNFTASAWIRRDETNLWNVIYAKRSTSITSLMSFRITNNNVIGLYSRDSDSNDLSVLGGSTLGSGEWFFVTGTREGGTLKVYLNGVLDGSINGQLSDIDTSGANAFLSLKGQGYDIDEHNGILDEVKISTSVRSADWIETEYNNQDDPSTFFAISTQQESPGNPIGYWSFDEGYGTTAHDEGFGGNDGTISGATWKDKSGCVSGKCLEFDGVDDYIDIGDINLTQDKITVAAWVRFDKVPVNGESSETRKGIVSKYDAANNKREFFLGLGNANNGLIDDGSALVWNVQENNSSFDLNNKMLSVTNFSANTWYYVVATFLSGNKMEIWVNGKLDSSKVINVATDFTNTDTPFLIGDGADNMKLDGSIDEVKIYNYVRSEDQIKQDYNAGLAGASTKKGTNVSFGGESDKWMSDGLVGHWRMDEANWNGTNGEVIDISGNGNHGTSAGDAMIQGGKYGGGGMFDGVGDYVDLGASTILNNVSAASSSFWVKVNSENTNAGILGLGSDLHRKHWCYSSSTDSQITCQFEDNNGNKTTIIAEEVMEAGSGWRHISNTYDGEIHKLYVDGVLSGSDSSISSILDTSGTNYIGKIDQFNNFNGQIDEVRVYNRALSPNEVKKLYEYAPGPVLDLKLDEKEGTVAYDKSGYENNATFHNSPTWTRGKYGNGLHFQDNTIDYIETPKDSSLNFSKAAGITLESWIYLETASDEHSIMSGWDGDVNMTDSSYWKVDNQNSQNYKIRNMIPGGVERSVSTTWDMNKWYFLSYTYDGETEMLYRDGVSVGSWAQTGNIEYEDEVGIMIGTAVQRTEDFDGKLDDVKIYNYARTQKQILEDMSTGNPAGKSPILHLSFDEGQGGVAYDESTHGNDGVLTPSTGGTNTTVASMWKKGGKIGGMIELDGTDDKIITPNSAALENLDAFSLSFWANLAGNYYSTAFFAKGVFYSGGHGWQLITDGSSNSGVLMFIRHYDTSNLSIVTEGGFLERDTWNYYTLTTDGTGSADGVHIYKNGIETSYGTKSDAAGTRDSDVAYDFVIGDTSSGGLWNYNGLMDEIKIWNYVISEDKIKYEYNGGKAMSLGGENTTANNNGTTVTGALTKYCVPGDTDTCDAPVLELDFDEKSGTTAYDKSGNGNDGTLTRMDSNTDWVRGKYGSALEFDGTDDYINIGNDSSLDITGNNITLEAWIKPIVSGMNRGWIIWKTSGWWDNQGYGMRINTNDRVEFYTRIKNNFVTSSVLQDNEWYHIVGIYDGINANLYINGILNATNTYTVPIVSNNSNALIGSNGGEFFDGKIDNVLIYNYTRTPSQIAWDYNKGKPFAHWKMDEGNGIVVHDESGNGNDGTMMNMDEDVDWTNGKFGKALDFDFVNDYVKIPDTTNSVFDIDSNISISVWVKPATVSGFDAYLRTVLTKGQYDSQAYGFYWDSGDGQLEFVLNNGIERLTVDYDYADRVGQWVHLIATYDSSFIKIYADGKLLGTKAYSATLPIDNDPICLGWDEDSTKDRYFKGVIDDVQIFNYALNKEQVKNVYNGGVIRFE